MRLAEGGHQRDTLSKTLNVLKTCVSINTMPLVIVCWTRHPEDVKAFKAAAENEFPGLKHGIVLSMQKPSTTSPDKWRNIRTKIKSMLKKYEASGLIWRWENILHVSATETSQTLAEVSARMISGGTKVVNWQDGLFSVCRELVKADIGEMNNKKSVSNSLFRMMNELAVDRIHHAILKKSLPCADKLIPHKDSDLGLEDTSRLNQMIIIDPVTGNDTSIEPGFIYVQSRGTRKCLFKKLGIGVKMIKNNITKDKFDGRITPILIEISPACDFTQNKRPVCTFIAGLLIPAESDSIKRIEGHREVFGPVTIPGYKGAKKIVVAKRVL
jgi:hypothetical protein